MDRPNRLSLHLSDRSYYVVATLPVLVVVVFHCQEAGTDGKNALSFSFVTEGFSDHQFESNKSQYSPQLNLYGTSTIRVLCDF